MKLGFTLIELIVVIIIVGILAAVGLSQYSITVEKSRVAEAKIRIGVMSKLAYEYYLNNGTFVGIDNPGVGVDNTCHSTDYYKYNVVSPAAAVMYFRTTRCSTDGKAPSGPNYNLQWGFSSNGRLYQQAYANSDGVWVYSDNWGPCCR